MKKFTELSWVIQAAMFVAVAAAIVAGAEYYYPGLQEMQAANNVAKQKLDSLKKENDAVRPFEQKFKEIQVDNKRLEQQLANLRTVVPDEKDADGFIRMIEEAGRASAVEIRRFTAGSVAQKEFYNEMPFELEIDGSYNNVLQFYDRLSRLPRIVNVANLSMGPTGASVRGVRKKYKYTPGETVIASFTATTFFGKGTGAAPAKKK